MILGNLGGQGVYLFPLHPLTSELELSTWIVRTGPECAYAHRKHATQAMHLHTHTSAQPAPHLSCNFCHLPRGPLGSGPTLQQTNPSPIQLSQSCLTTWGWDEGPCGQPLRH